MLRFKKYYVYGGLFLILGFIVMYSSESNPPSDPYVVGIALVALSTFYLLGVGVVHFAGWAFGSSSENEISQD